MLLTMKEDATPEHIEAVVREIEAHGFAVHRNQGAERTLLGCVGHVEADKAALVEHFSVLPGVERAELISEPYKLASRRCHPQDSIVPVDGVPIGGRRLWICAGPCAVESTEQIEQTAAAVRELGASALRGGCWKPRTSPWSFQGLGEAGVLLLQQAGRQAHLPTVSEVMSNGQIALAQDRVTVLQVGARNMQNYPLLLGLGRCPNPILLKRGPAATLDEFVLSAEYLLSEGHRGVVLCLRGVVPLQGTKTRYQADLDAIPLLKQMTHLPVIFDPSHAAGRADLVVPLSCAAVAAGADGLLIEVHPNPAKALSDPKQQLTFEQFAALMSALRRCAADFDRTI